ncbi:MAG: helix-turn-helix transcriptional regulator [Cyanobacteriota bacterium]|nr:helix-turn-helix transcriptional regulator [Cyanobacteriota bacterium]
MAGPLKRSWFNRLRRSVGGADAVVDAGPRADEDPLLAIGASLRQAREARGLGLRQLAAETLISTSVLEALERGWRDRLPESAYLRTMLPLLERYLALEPGSLRALLRDDHLGQPQRSPQAGARLPLLSVELFTTWQGTAAYGALVLALLYGLNLEQRRLAAKGLHALRPVPPLPEAALRRLPPAGDDLLLQAYPELRPLTAAGRGRGLQLAQRQGGQLQQDADPGVLELELRQPAQLSLEAASGVRTSLQAGPGTLLLPLTPPLTLSLAPGTAQAEVRWNGEPLKAEPPGTYRWPRPARAASSP